MAWPRESSAILIYLSKHVASNAHRLRQIRGDAGIQHFLPPARALHERSAERKLRARFYDTPKHKSIDLLSGVWVHPVLQNGRQSQAPLLSAVATPSPNFQFAGTSLDSLAATHYLLQAFNPSFLNTHNVLGIWTTFVPNYSLKPQKLLLQKHKEP